MSQNLSSAAVVIGALRVKKDLLVEECFKPENNTITDSLQEWKFFIITIIAGFTSLLHTLSFHRVIYSSMLIVL